MRCVVMVYIPTACSRLRGSAALTLTSECEVNVKRDVHLKFVQPKPIRSPHETACITVLLSTLCGLRTIEARTGCEATVLPSHPVRVLIGLVLPTHYLSES